MARLRGPTPEQIRRQWGLLLAAVGSALVLLGLLWPGIPTLEGGSLWNPWAWRGFLLGWIGFIVGVLLAWPAPRRRR